MGISEKLIWILIQHHDQEGLLRQSGENVENSLRRVALPTNLTLQELKLSVQSWAGVGKDRPTIIKIRTHDHSLVPISTLLHGSSKEKPFIIEVVDVHQDRALTEKTIPPDYVFPLKLRLKSIEKRISRIEVSIPEVATSYAKFVEDVANQLIDCVGYLNRRLDELTPSDWKKHLYD